MGLRINASGQSRLDPPLARNSRGHALACWQWPPKRALGKNDQPVGSRGGVEPPERSPACPGFSLLGDRLPNAADQIDPRINLNNQAWSATGGV